MSIGVNLRVTGYCRQGGRKYMEDFFSVAYQQTEDEKDLEYAFIGIFDGHGGAEAAAFAKEHLMESIIKHKSFWSDNDTEVLRAIKDGYIATHYAMWNEQAKWPKTPSGLPSTAGTTASVAFIRKGKIYVGHVGDSGIVLGYQLPNSNEWKAKPLTKDHKPENVEELCRIHECGGKVIAKAGVPRVVWNRPRIGHQGPIRRSTPIDEIPFLAVARSLGDLWSYNSRLNQFIVSPNPDCGVIAIDTSIHRCLIFGTDGLFNMMSPQMAVTIVHQTEKNNEAATIELEQQKGWLNPSKLLVEKALERWQTTNLRADNTSVVTLMLDPPGPPRAQVLQKKHSLYPMTGFKIFTRFNNDEHVSDEGKTLQRPDRQVSKDDKDVTEEIIHVDDGQKTPPTGVKPETEEPGANCSTKPQVPFSEVSSNPLPLKERNFVPKPRDSLPFDPRESCSPSKLQNEKENQSDEAKGTAETSVQINEISSSSTDLFENVEEETDDDQSSLIKRNLRSMGKFKAASSTEQKLKRKHNEEEPLRKSMRIDNARRKSDRLEGNRKKHQNKSKLDLARKILKKKKLTLKKKILTRPLLRNHFQMILKTVKKTSKKSLIISAKNALPKRNNSVAPKPTNIQKNQKSTKKTKRSLSSVHESSKERTGTNSSPSGEWKVDPVKRTNSMKKNSPKASRTKSLGRLDSIHTDEVALANGRKTPQRISLRHQPQNQTPKLRRRLSRSK